MGVGEFFFSDKISKRNKMPEKLGHIFRSLAKFLNDDALFCAHRKT